MSPYRDSPAIPCPRCKRKLAGLDVCMCDCGVWVSTFAARLLLSAQERRKNPTLRWWRMREPCPICSDQMLLRGEEPGLLQGCDLHGFWIDADTITHTTLRNGIDRDALAQQREDPFVVAAHDAAIQSLVAERAAKHAATLVAQRPRAVVVRDDPEEAARLAEVEHLAECLREALGRESTKTLLDRLTAIEFRIAALERNRRD